MGFGQEILETEMKNMYPNQASQDCFGKISIDIDSAAVQLEKCPISEMKTAVIKLKRLAMPNLKG